MAKKKKLEPTEPLIGFASCNPVGPDTNVKDNWNQITLSLASNGGFTINSGKNYLLNVFLKETIEGKQVTNVKTFLVTKQELSDLEAESKEFSDEIEKMLAARDSEESIKSAPSKSTVKDEKKKDEEKKATGKALTGILKKSLDSVKKKAPPIDYDNSLDEIDDRDRVPTDPDRDLDGD